MLYQVKENMVCVWIDQDRHFDNTITNKIEHAHSRFKKYFLDSKSDFCKGWKSMNNMIVLHHNDIPIFENELTTKKGVFGRYVSNTPKTITM